MIFLTSRIGIYLVYIFPIERPLSFKRLNNNKFGVGVLCKRDGITF
jgi:hypothetical protein